MAEDSYDALVERVDEALSVMERDENLGMELPIDVLQADPEHFYALSVLSQVLLGRGDYAPAAQAAQRLIDRYPDDDLGISGWRRSCSRRRSTKRPSDMPKRPCRGPL